METRIQIVESGFSAFGVSGCLPSQGTRQVFELLRRATERQRGSFPEGRIGDVDAHHHHAERVCLLPSGAQEHIALLKCAGILDEDGQLAQRYRAGLEGEADCSPRAAGTAS